MKHYIALAGVAIVAAGLVLGFGVVPASQTCFLGVCGEVDAAFVYSNPAHSTVLYLNDTTAVSGTVSISAVTVSWGDSEASTFPALGFDTTHTYSRAATYNVTETVLYMVPPSTTPGISSVSFAVAVGGGAHGSAHHAAPLFAWSVLTGLLVVAGASLAVAALVAPDPRMLAIAAGSGAVIGAIVGWGFGGHVWL